jgi:hypothetical protein
VRAAATQQRDSCELVKIRCERGSSIVRKLGFSEAVAAGIYSLDEHWNGGGYPNGLLKQEIPLYACIANLAQTLEVFLMARGRKEAVEAARLCSGRWFNPDLVDATHSLCRSGKLWEDLEKEDLIEHVLALEATDRRLGADDKTIDAICLAFAEIIDSKSPFTYRHPVGVADAASDIARHIGMGGGELRKLRRAALLHDIGKLGFERHPGETRETYRRGILSGAPASLSHLGNSSPPSRVLRFQLRRGAAPRTTERQRLLAGTDGGRVVASRENPRCSRRFRRAQRHAPLPRRSPYRKGFSMMREDAPHALDWLCLDALMESRNGSEPHAISTGFAYHHGRSRYEAFYPFRPASSAHVTQSSLLAGEYDNSSISVGTQTVGLSYAFQFQAGKSVSQSPVVLRAT